MELVTFKKFKSEEEASFLVELLESNNIEYQVEDISAAVDITFTGGTELEDKIAVLISPSDSEKADELLSQLALDNLDAIDDDHYLFEFTDDELVEVLEKFDEWNELDYILAHKILIDRGVGITDEKVDELKQKRIEELRKPEKGDQAWLILGYITAVLGGVIGILIGYYHSNFKKIISTGEEVLAFDIETRKTGLRILNIGIVGSIFWIIVWILYLVLL